MRLVEDGSECSGARVSKAVGSDTASERQGGNGERVIGVSMGADMRASDGGGGALERGHGAALEPLAQLGDALVSDVVAGETAREVVAVGLQACQWALTRKRTLGARRT